MQDYFIFDEGDLVKIGLVCPTCNTEAVFDLGKDLNALVSRDCPGCGNREFVENFVNEARHIYNWITWYKRVQEVKKHVAVRLYFKKP